MGPIIIPSEYGYVLATAVISGIFVVTLGASTGYARKAANIPYPYVYAERAEAEQDPKKHIFNCTQRAHQNTLEALPLYNLLLLISGIEYPKVASAAGLVWVAGRALYASGYKSGDPEKRHKGDFSYIGLFTLLGTSIYTIYQLLK
ncbi:hypothetical protein J3Q64DRAFT_1025109 [Phycomyces blakesleeanus]|uniref:Glutathione S-transferase 3, mitochondrial n=2 Tax=Phycomyces blakesleeanus TaxID=4837 RepID=A0A167P6C0_PHYB8|nr:hypothetical protein PHYBLDRAFT_122324 [Phycomyces blakesleeanus NRRL 1555(-)]OAD77334.1 hypothetical protein PHYBLDRAFT_122324 [Phycomyces blakesleeanus NRRL 1555(-)]|eukprot:XP_018295374.1 hypothetical protein PHYBLDRAFT_122324 [Phycomyces blakesleeanus NRRL 1555(-)]